MAVFVRFGTASERGGTARGGQGARIHECQSAVQEGPIEDRVAASGLTDGKGSGKR